MYRFLTTIPYVQPEQNDRKQYESYSFKLKEKNHLTKINGHYNFSYTFDQYKKYHVIDTDYSNYDDDILYDAQYAGATGANKLSEAYRLQDVNFETAGQDILVTGYPVKSELN